MRNGSRATPKLEQGPQTVVFEIANGNNSVYGHMSELKKKLEDIGAGMAPAALQLASENRALS
jgi:hypothetical protein